MSELPRGLVADPALAARSHAIWISGPLPGMNEIIELNNTHRSSGRRGQFNAYVAEKKRQTRRIAELALSAALPKMARAYFVFEWNERKRNRNPDNIAAAIKFVLDGLVTAKIIPNDGWDEIAGWENHFFVTKEQPGVWVTLRELPSSAAAPARRRRS